MMDSAWSLFYNARKAISLTAFRGDRIFTYALLLPFVLLLFLLDWDHRLFLFLFLAYSAAFLGFMVARSLGAFARKTLDEEAAQARQAGLTREREDQYTQTIRQLTLELAQIKEREKRPSTATEQISSIMASHELQEPLRTIRSFIQLLQDRHLQHLNDEGQDFLHFIGDAAGRMQEMVEGVLAYSSVSETAQLVQPVNLNFVAADVLRLLGSRIRDARAIVQVDELPHLPIEPLQFSHLLHNLLDNALKYCKEKIPVIKIQCLRQENEWVFRVRDNGIGIEPEFHRAVFNLFRRLHGVGVYSGSGMGLAICKKIVENHNGKIWVESEGTGKGSAFCFTLNAQKNVLKTEP